MGRGGGQMKFYSYENGGHSLSHAEGGGGEQKKFWGSFSAGA